MNVLQHVTFWLVVLPILGWIAYDVPVAIYRPEATISTVCHDAAERYPVAVFAIGIAFGHILGWRLLLVLCSGLVVGAACWPRWKVPDR